jgi:hypothetical protein
VNFELSIAIDPAGLAQINSAYQYVTITRAVNAFAASAAALNNASALPYSVAWLAFTPYQNNVVTWTDACNLYASTTTGTVNTVITVNSATTAALAGQSWTFQNGQFVLPVAGSGSAYSVTNAAANGLSFGLLAAAVVNGTSINAPMNLQPALLNETAQFTPSETVSIFLSSVSAAGTVIPNVSGLTVTLSAGTTNIGFNDSTNQFFLAG